MLQRRVSNALHILRSVCFFCGLCLPNWNLSWIRQGLSVLYMQVESPACLGRVEGRSQLGRIKKM